MHRFVAVVIVFAVESVTVLAQSGPAVSSLVVNDPPPTETITTRADVTPVNYVPGNGFTVSMLNGQSQLKLFGQFSAIGQFATRRPFPSGGTLFLLPPPASGNSTNTFDLHARQTAFGTSFSGPDVLDFSPGAYFLGFIQNDDLTSDAYGLLPFNAYGELKNDSWRISAGLMNDVFNPLKPNMISLLNLFSSGNTGSFRGQARVERVFTPTKECKSHPVLRLANPCRAYSVTTG